MKSAHLIAVALGGITLVAGAASLNGTYVHIDRAQGNNGTGSYSMTLNKDTNTLFNNGYGAGTASSVTGGGHSTVGFQSFVFNEGDKKATSYGTNCFAMTGVHNGVHTMFANTEPFHDIKSITVKFTYDATNALSTFYLYTSSTAFTEIPNTNGSSMVSKHPKEDLFDGADDHYFAITLSGYSGSGSSDYHIAIEWIVITYAC